MSPQVFKQVKRQQRRNRRRVTVRIYLSKVEAAWADEADTEPIIPTTRRSTT